MLTWTWSQAHISVAGCTLSDLGHRLHPQWGMYRLASVTAVYRAPKTVQFNSLTTLTGFYAMYVMIGSSLVKCYQNSAPPTIRSSLVKCYQNSAPPTIRFTLVTCYQNSASPTISATLLGGGNETLIWQHVCGNLPLTRLDRALWCSNFNMFSWLANLCPLIGMAAYHHSSKNVIHIVNLPGSSQSVLNSILQKLSTLLRHKKCCQRSILHLDICIFFWWFMKTKWILLQGLLQFYINTHLRLGRQAGS